MSVLPALPSDWKAPESFLSVSAFSAPVKRQIEPVGPGFLAHARRTLRNRTWSEDEKIQAEQNVKKADDGNDADLLEEEPEDPALYKLEPRDWKNQDHYAVLGITKLRYNATEEQIRIAHRRKVLKHHPDKKAAQGQLNEDGFFKCIQKAFELLMDPVRRRQFDSVDKAADVAPPSKKSKGDFIELWKPFFDAYARFSNVQPVPSLGSMESTKAEVDGFYSFWYQFDSWRSFEYLDEDVPDDSSNRDNKRYIERKNKAARQKHKTDDTARLRRLVDEALNSDPRIKMFKDAEKKAKEQAKWEKEAGARAAKEAEEKAKAEAEKAKAEAEKAAKDAKEAGKKSKEAAKNAKKKNKRAIRNSAKDVNYFADGEASASQIDNVLNDIDALIEKFDDVQLQEVATKVGGITDVAAVKSVFEEASASLVSSGKLSSGSLKFFSV